ncbi:hypothetical protein [Macellibacteroides fermentans]|uniref:hypothetical protein n=1 Tax=Macellibacteroides fermentans TaxID=879969 RepID=UPI00406CE68B
MHNTDSNKVIFHSKEDIGGGYYLQKGEHILQADTKSIYSDINEVLELYNLKKYIDNDLYLKSWSTDDIANFKTKATEYGNVIGQFMATIYDSNVVDLYENILQEYIHSFWELVNNQSTFKRISKTKFTTIITNEPHLIHEILIHKKLVDHYDNEIKNFLMTYPQSAEILLSIYEVQHNFTKNQKLLPKSLSIEEKETIISNYLDSNDVNYNYLELIQNAKTRNDFKISDKTRLKAKRLHKSETEKVFVNNGGLKFGVSISFPENSIQIKDMYVDENLIAHYSFSLDFIRQNNDPYSLYRNFKDLFEYVDRHNRINLVSKTSQMSVFERIIGVHSQNEYRFGTAFSLSEMASYAQILGYNRVLAKLCISLESILHFVFTTAFQEKYNFASNAHFSIPTAPNSNFEKVRLLAPEFESILKQYKLYVEDKAIDLELLQISSAPSAIKDIPSLNNNKYIYFNEDNEEMLLCSNLIFSDQTLLASVEPFKNKQYNTFFDLLANEEGNVKFSNYEEYQKPQLQYLIDKGFISVDNNEIIQVSNAVRLLIFNDLYNNEYASFYHYPIDFQVEVTRMKDDNIVFFERSLFSKPEQSYFNYFLNKSEFTNGLDLRNSYLHGTQASPNEAQKHEYAYFTYLKLLFLTMLKIEDDLLISIIND